MNIQGNGKMKKYSEKNRIKIAVEHTKKANMSFELGIELNFFFSLLLNQVETDTLFKQITFK